MKILCVIPSRIGSTRLARKPLLLVQGKAMVQRVYENARCCKLFTKVVVATDSTEIRDLIEAIGGSVMMTNAALPTGSDRTACVARAYPDMDVIVNLQGDEPFIKASMLEQLVAPFTQGETLDMSTLAFPIESPDEFTNPGIVKVITDINSNALYFSRAAIPYVRIETPNTPVYHHLGLYAFRRDFLLHYTTLKPTPLELNESLEQLRVLENGFKIRVCLTEHKTIEINTPEELAAAQDFVFEA